MDQSESLWQFMHQQSGKLLQQTVQHIGLTFISLLIAVLIGLPLGIYITRHKRAAGLVLGIAGVLQTIPSIALLGFMIPLLGIGPLPAITALFLYALLPVIRNTYTGIDGVDPGVREAAVAMGMTIHTTPVPGRPGTGLPGDHGRYPHSNRYHRGRRHACRLYRRRRSRRIYLRRHRPQQYQYDPGRRHPRRPAGDRLDFLLSRLQRTSTKGRGSPRSV
jgi:hypothetical protein